MNSLSFTPAAGSPAAGRIAEIRSKLGSSARTPSDFSQRLDAAVAAQAPAAAVSIEQAVSSSAVSEHAISAISAGATNAAPSILAALEKSAASDENPGVDEGTLVGHSVVSADIPYADLFNEAGQRHGVNPILLAAVAQVESGFDPAAVSSAGAGGLMQFMPATADEMGVNRFEPASAVDGAARYLARDLARFGRLDLAIAAYNAGPAAVANHGGIPPISETQRYVEKVLTAMEAHQ